MAAHLAIIATDRLEISRFDRSDAEARHVYQGRSDVAQYLYRAPLTFDQCVEGIERAFDGALDGDGASLLLAVRLRGDRRLIGEVVLTCADARAAQFEIGWVFNPDDGSRGYATEAARAVTQFAFAEAAAHRVFARIDAQNLRSIALCERLGFRREAHFIENDRHPTGDWGSEYVYGALAADVTSLLAT